MMRARLIIVMIVGLITLSGCYHTKTRQHDAYTTTNTMNFADSSFYSTHHYAQNYNFFSNYVDLFANTIGKTNKFNSERQINLYGLFKANTYTIQFDVNNSKGDNYYLDYNNSNQFIAEFASDMIGFRTKVGENTQTFVAM